MDLSECARSVCYPYHVNRMFTDLTRPFVDATCVLQRHRYYCTILHARMEMHRTCGVAYVVRLDVISFCDEYETSVTWNDSDICVPLIMEALTPPTGAPAWKTRLSDGVLAKFGLEPATSPHYEVFMATARAVDCALRAARIGGLERALGTLLPSDVLGEICDASDLTPDASDASVRTCHAAEETNRPFKVQMKLASRTSTAWTFRVVERTRTVPGSAESVDMHEWHDFDDIDT